MKGVKIRIVGNAKEAREVKEHILRKFKADYFGEIQHPISKLDVGPKRLEIYMTLKRRRT